MSIKKAVIYARYSCEMYVVGAYLSLDYFGTLPLAQCS